MISKFREFFSKKVNPSVEFKSKFVEKLYRDVMGDEWVKLVNRNRSPLSIGESKYLNSISDDTYWFERGPRTFPSKFTFGSDEHNGKNMVMTKHEDEYFSVSYNDGDRFHHYEVDTFEGIKQLIKDKFKRG